MAYKVTYRQELYVWLNPWTAYYCNCLLTGMLSLAQLAIVALPGDVHPLNCLTKEKYEKKMRVVRNHPLPLHYLS